MKTSKKELTGLLIARLWDQYLKRVCFAQKYIDLVNKKGGKVVHDHIAFRTFNIHTGEQPEGISAIDHIIRVLDYHKSGEYKFHKMKLSACHYEHPDQMLPKIFVSQLEVSEFPEWFQNLIYEKVAETPYLLSDQGIELLNLVAKDGILPVEAAEILVGEMAGYFRRPWDLVPKESILKINDVSQYAAWTLLHGNSVNHFAALINFQEINDWPDLESTCLALQNAGIPLKESIEGEKNSKLRQSATRAVLEDVEVLDNEGEVDKLKWTYAYYELVERGFIDETNNKRFFPGFLVEQDVHLFCMTHIRQT